LEQSREEILRSSIATKIFGYRWAAWKHGTAHRSEAPFSNVCRCEHSIRTLSRYAHNIQDPTDTGFTVASAHHPKETFESFRCWFHSHSIVVIRLRKKRKEKETHHISYVQEAPEDCTLSKRTPLSYSEEDLAISALRFRISELLILDAKLSILP
jgi:hypothetical protein